MKLTLQVSDIAMYLPYGLTFLNTHGEVKELDCISGNSVNIKGRGYTYGMYCDIDEIKPLLRPMSDLSMMINNNGENFVPIELLLDLETKCNWSCSDHLTTSYGIKSYWTKIESGSTFGYNEYGYFYLIDKFDVYYPVKHQKQLFEKLAEWLFDYNDLIGKGFAIDINTIEL